MSDPGTSMSSPTRDASDLVAYLEQQGDEPSVRRAQELALRVTEWESDVRNRFAAVLAVHHDVNNALTGVLGNAQLLLMGPAAELPGVRKRLQTLLEEAERIRDVAARMRDLRRDLMNPQLTAGLDSPPGKPKES